MSLKTDCYIHYNQFPLFTSNTFFLKHHPYKFIQRTHTYDNKHLKHLPYKLQNCNYDS